MQKLYILNIHFCIISFFLPYVEITFCPQDSFAYWYFFGLETGKSHSNLIQPPQYNIQGMLILDFDEKLVKHVLYYQMKESWNYYLETVFLWQQADFSCDILMSVSKGTWLFDKVILSWPFSLLHVLVQALYGANFFIIKIQNFCWHKHKKIFYLKILL